MGGLALPGEWKGYGISGVLVGGAGEGGGAWD